MLDLRGQESDDEEDEGHESGDEAYAHDDANTASREHRRLRLGVHKRPLFLQSLREDTAWLCG